MLLEQSQQEIYQNLLHIAGEAITTPISSEVIPIGQEKRDIADATTKILIKRPNGHPVAVAICSPRIAPDIVARSIQRSRLAKQALGHELEHVVLETLAEGKIEGLSYAIFPYCQALSNSKLGWPLQRLQLSPLLFQTLHQMMATTIKPVPDAELESSFCVPLQYLVDSKIIPEPLPSLARQALKHIASNQWLPYYTLMHNDLWKGNILLRISQGRNESISKNAGMLVGKRLASKVVIIDWAGSMVNGYPIYDLVRLAQSMKMSDRAFLKHLSEHCCTLQCELTDATHYLLAALGYLGMHLECFPVDRYLALAIACLKTLQKSYQNGT